MANGQSRILLARAQLKRSSQSEINASFKNENEVAKATKKFPLKNPTKNNHSK